jgi:hypothetical protein
VTDIGPVLLSKMNDGREVPTKPCHCGACDGEFFVPAYSEEWMPSFCCYCGIRFVTVTIGDTP